ncbi:PQQ-binding-like beta-propeller repeat protein [Propionibacteriaceae bacterium Y1685]
MSVIDALTKKDLLWSDTWPAVRRPAARRPLIVGDRVLIVQQREATAQEKDTTGHHAGRLRCLSVTDGAPLWELEDHRLALDPCRVGGLTWWTGYFGDLVRVDDDGEIVDEQQVVEDSWHVMPAEGFAVVRAIPGESFVGRIDTSTLATDWMVAPVAMEAITTSLLIDDAVVLGGHGIPYDEDEADDDESEDDEIEFEDPWGARLACHAVDSGDLRWVTTRPGYPVALWTAPRGLLVCTRETWSLLDTATGEVIIEKPAPALVQGSGASRADDLLLPLAEEKGLAAVDPETLEVRWHAELAGAMSDHLVVDDQVLVLTEKGVLHALSGADGTEQWRLSLGAGLKGGSGALQVDHDHLVVAQGRGVACYRIR